MTFDVFAFKKTDEDGVFARRTKIPAWMLPAIAEWATGEGYDTILLEQTTDLAVVHHVCDDPACPGGCV